MSSSIGMRGKPSSRRPSRAKVSSMTANCSGGRRSFAAWLCGRVKQLYRGVRGYPAVADSPAGPDRISRSGSGSWLVDVVQPVEDRPALFGARPGHRGEGAAAPPPRYHRLPSGIWSLSPSESPNSGYFIIHANHGPKAIPEYDGLLASSREGGRDNSGGVQSSHSFRDMASRTPRWSSSRPRTARIAAIGSTGPTHRFAVPLNSELGGPVR